MIRSLCLALVLILSTLSVRAETFVFPEQGFSLETPNGWHVLAADAAVQMLENSDFGEELKNTDSPASQLLALVRDKPIVGVTPGVFVNYHPGVVSDIDEGLNRVAELLDRNLREFQILQPPTLTRLGSFEAGVMRYRYVTSVGGEYLEVIETFWLIPDGDHYITLSAGLAPKDEATVQPLIEATAMSLTGL